ncbi:MAG: hypothetical protein EOP86_01750 [Verrucomicrobiaceae bacterium]|nr:MAG: hypothetical protein EOP86_01750 [Verrucomicrobiaceae bacterium]
MNSIRKIGSGQSPDDLSVTLTDGSTLAVPSDWVPSVISQIEALIKSASSPAPMEVRNSPVTSLSFGVHRHR